eukprot:766746-Hanusia_phi.AAC.5
MVASSSVVAETVRYRSTVPRRRGRVRAACRTAAYKAAQWARGAFNASSGAAGRPSPTAHGPV